MSAERSTQPPRLALWLLRRLLPDAEREPFVGDVLEEWYVAVVRRGHTAARRWFWRQTVIALLTLHGHRTLAEPTQPAGDPRMLTFLADVRHGVRLLRRSPAFTILAVLTLALGVGATTAIFSVADPVLFRPLPYPNADRLVVVGERDANGSMSNLGYLTFVDFARGAKTLERSAAAGSWQATLDGNGGMAPERVNGQRVSPTFFSMLGVRPALGRDFLPSEDTPGTNLVVIISHGLWVRRYGSDSSVVGKPISVNGAAYLLAGVLPASFESVIQPGAEIWRVLGYDQSLPYACRTCRHLRMYARLRPGVAPEGAAAELSQLSARLVREYPKEYPAAGAIVQPLSDATMGTSRPVLWAVLGASVLVLLIAAANVANLQLARAMRREEEFAIRSALGAGRGRLTAQLVAEGIVLAPLGGAAGLLVARATLGTLVGQLPPTMPRLGAISLNGTALGVGAFVTLLLGVVVGLVPAHAEGGRSLLALRGGRHLTGGRHVARAGLVVSEVALALMLLVGAGLLARSLLGLLSVDPGFDPTHLLTLQTQATGPKYPDSTSVYANHDRVLEAVRALPGVERAGTASQLPLGGNVDSYGVAAQDKPLANPELAPYADRYVVSPDFMQTMGIAIQRGRPFTAADNSDAAPLVAIVSSGLAKRIWPGEDPIGKRIRIGGPSRPWRTVIGVAANIHHRALDATESSQFYLPERQWPFVDNSVALVVRTHGDPESLARAVRAAVQGADATQPITALATMQQVIATSTAQRRLALLLFIAFATIALVLAVAGIYGVLAGAVAERTREFGLRSALGASPGAILALVLLQGARLAGAGLLLGLAGALSLGRLLQSLLYGVGATDPVTLGGVVLLLALVALAACVLPALRALGIDPIVALRAE